MTHFFISYVREREDAEFSENLRSRLQSEGFETWIDRQHIVGGTLWQPAIDQALRKAAGVIVVMTPAAKASEYVTYEWAFALGANVPVIPVLLKPTDLHSRLASLQCIDLTAPVHLRLWEPLYDCLRAVIAKDTAKVYLTPDMIQALLADFDSHDSNVHSAAICSLGCADQDAAREALTEALQHRRWDVRIEAAITLVEKGIEDNEPVIPILIDALHGPQQYMGRRAGSALLKIGDPAVPAVIAALRSPDDQTRAWASAILGAQKNALAVPALIEMLHEEVVNVPSYAIAALGNIGNAEAMSAIVELIKKLRGLVDMADHKSPDTYQQSPPFTEFRLVAASVQALQTIGFPAVSVLVEVVEWLISLEWIIDYYIAQIPGPFDDVISTSVAALGTIGSSDAVPVLLKALPRSRFVRYRAHITEALLAIGGPAAIESLRGLLHDPACSSELQPIVRQLLQRLGAPEI
jgi:HEAT repeat protein